MEVNDVLKLLRQASSLGIEHLKLGDLEVEFNPEFVSKKKLKRLERKASTVEETEIKRSELDLKDEQLDEMMITDPVALEKVMMSDAKLEN